VDKPRGFTLTELVVVVFIIGLLSVLVVPKLSNNIQHSNESASLGSLGAIRSALNVYYGDNAGYFPFDLGPLTQPGSNYLSAFPPLYTADHGRSANVSYAPSEDGSMDTGNWGYVNAGSQQGTVWIQCTHTDSRGNVWSHY
jgi:general secretion pathway protein G